MLPQEDIPRGVRGENYHQNHPYYSYPRIPPHPHTRIPPHPHQNMPPHTYPSMPTYPNLSYTYCTSTPVYAPYVVSHHPNIPSFVYLHRLTSRLPSLTFPKLILHDASYVSDSPFSLPFLNKVKSPPWYYPWHYPWYLPGTISKGNNSYP